MLGQFLHAPLGCCHPAPLCKDRAREQCCLDSVEGGINDCTQMRQDPVALSLEEFRFVCTDELTDDVSELPLSGLDMSLDEAVVALDGLEVRPPFTRGAWRKDESSHNKDYIHRLLRIRSTEHTGSEVPMAGDVNDYSPRTGFEGELEDDDDDDGPHCSRAGRGNLDPFEQAQLRVVQTQSAALLEDGSAGSAAFGTRVFDDSEARMVANALRLQQSAEEGRKTVGPEHFDMCTPPRSPQVGPSEGPYCTEEKKGSSYAPLAEAGAA